MSQLTWMLPNGRYWLLEDGVPRMETLEYKSETQRWLLLADTMFVAEFVADGLSHAQDIALAIVRENDRLYAL